MELVPLRVAEIVVRGRYFIKHGDYNRALQLYECAIEEARIMKMSTSQIGALSSTAGNICLEVGKFRQAIKHFTNGLEAVLLEREFQPDPRAIELSLKISECFIRTGDTVNAEKGYIWLIHEANQLMKYHKKQLRISNSNSTSKQDNVTELFENIISLLGLGHEQYGLFLVGVDRFQSHGLRLKEARRQFLLAADVARMLPQSSSTSVIARCFIHAAQCSLDLGNVNQALLDIQEAQHICSDSKCEVYNHVKEVANNIEHLQRIFRCGMFTDSLQQLYASDVAKNSFAVSRSRTQDVDADDRHLLSPLYPIQSISERC
eukprot:gene9439-1681_t